MRSGRDSEPGAQRPGAVCDLQFLRLRGIERGSGVPKSVARGWDLPALSSPRSRPPRPIRLRLDFVSGTDQLESRAQLIIRSDRPPLGRSHWPLPRRPMASGGAEAAARISIRHGVTQAFTRQGLSELPPTED